MIDYTQLDDIHHVSIHYNNGDRQQVTVEAIVRNGDAQPLWLVHLDDMDCHVITPWMAIRDITILTHRVT